MNNQLLFEYINTKIDINSEWIQRQQYKGRLYNDFIALHFEEIVAIAQDVYPDKWNILVRPTIDNNDRKIYLAFYLTIKFDNITITDGKNEHLIQDLYVSIPLSSYISNICGLRGKFHISEYKDNYLHSHLSSGRTPNFPGYSFCLGSSGIQETLTVMRNSSWDAQLFKMLLIQLEEYVSWESIDGGPYKHLANIGSSLGLAELNITVEKYQELINLIDEYLTTDDIDLTVDNGTFKILKSEKLDKALIKFLPDEYKTYFKYDNYYSYVTHNSDLDYPINDKLIDMIWNKQPLKELIITYEPRKLNLDVRINPLIINIVTNYLESKIVKTIYKNE